VNNYRSGEAMTGVRRQNINILLVDDSAFARSVGNRVLRNAGIESIQEAASGRIAIDLLAQFGETVDVVFCDLMMPDMDGVEMIRHIAALPVQPALVFLSVANAALLNTAEDTARARGLRVLGIIQKPLTPDAVRRVLGRIDDQPGPVESRSVVVTPADLEVALEKEQIVLHFQPKVSLTAGSVVGFEALARWQHPDKGMIPPTVFIGVAEQCGKIGALTDRVTKLALRQCADWMHAGMSTRVSVNLSAYTLVNLDLPDRLVKEAERFGVHPRQLILEITESGLFHDTADTLEILARLHMKGFPLSIDDFGTGYSSMEQLRRIPFAEMKIDRAFVNGAADSAKARAILESSAALGRSLQMSVVAEGVETREDWSAVRTAGVDLVQGYFVAKPMAADQIPAWLVKSGRQIEIPLLAFAPPAYTPDARHG